MTRSLLVRHALGIPDTGPAGMLALLEANLTSEEFQVFDGKRIVQTPEGALFEIARAYYLRRGVLIPMSAAVDFANRGSHADAILSLLPELKALPVEPTDVPRLVDELRSAHRKFLLAEKSHRFLSSARDADDDMLTRITSDFSRDLLALAHTNGHDPFISLRAQAPDYVKRAEAQWENPVAARGLLTGMTRFDMATNGLFPGEELLLIGDMKTGKSALEMFIAYNIHRAGGHPVMVLKEMPPEDIMRRFTAMDLARTDFGADTMRVLKTGELTEQQKGLFRETWRRIEESSGDVVLIPPEECFDLAQVEVALDRVAREHPISCILVDAGQKFNFGGRDGMWNQGDEQLQLAVRFQELGFRHECPVIVDVQPKTGAGADSGLVGIGRGRGWGETCTYALRLIREEGLRLRMKMAGSRNSSSDLEFDMFFDPERMVIENIVVAPGIQ